MNRLAFLTFLVVVDVLILNVAPLQLIGNFREFLRDVVDAISGLGNN